MTATCIGFTGWESGERTNFGKLSANDSIQSGTALVGTYSLEVDPVNANNVLKTYGAHLQMPVSTRTTTRAMTVFRFKAPATWYDELVSLYEIEAPGSNLVRRLILTKGGKFQLLDKDEDVIFSAFGQLVNGDEYLIRVDTQLNKDVVYLYDLDGATPAWSTEVDVDNHGDINTPFDDFFWGAGFGKTLPTSGGPHYLDEIALFDMEGSTPSSDSIGQIVTRRLIVNGVSLDNDDFPGTVADVDEVINDGDTSYDESGTVGHKQGYDVVDATGSEVPLACQIVGYATRNGGSGNGDIDYKYGFYRPTGAVFDMSETVEQHQATYRQLGFGDQTSSDFRQYTIWNNFDGSAWTNAIFDEIEVTVEVITADNSAKFRLTNIAAEYYVEGSISSPADFPDEPPGATGVDDVSISVI